MKYLDVRVKPRYVLPADVFHALHFASLTVGGVGRGTDFRKNADGEQWCPVCIHGLAQFIDGSYSGPTSEALIIAGIGRLTVNDATVRDMLNERKSGGNGRVPFLAMCKRANIVAGDTP